MNTSNSKDIFVKDLDIKVPARTLIVASDLKINYGQKYGLIGKNGSGKSTLLSVISSKSIDIPKNLDVFLVSQEFNFDTNKTVYEIVAEANHKKNKLLKKLLEFENNYEEYQNIQQKLCALDVTKDEAIIRKILSGLGFNREQQDHTFGSFSGGWKMRCVLARALWMQPHLLLLDEPTNHLDINAVIWLTDYLKNWKKSLIIVSHDIYFINQVCTKIIHIENNKLNYYNGNYDTFVSTYKKHQVELQKQWDKILRRKKEMQNKSTKKEIVDKFMKDNAHLEPLKPYVVKIKFYEIECNLKNPYVNLSNITFGYDYPLFADLNLTINSNDKFIIVGKNGVGKSTLLQIITEKMKFTGSIDKNPNLKIGYYHQHLTDTLPLDKTPIEFLNLGDDAKKYLGQLGLTKDLFTKQISLLSGGQKARVVLAQINSMNPHLLLLDEPTNHLDMESLHALINAINTFDGAIILITHNLTVIEQINGTIYHLENAKLNEVSLQQYIELVLEETDQ